MPADLAEWLTYLESLHPKQIELGLERVARVKQAMQLEADFPLIVVAGTNGKGSVCAMLEAMLSLAGYRVGCYTSPHLLRYNERVRIDRQPVSDQLLCDSFTQIEQLRGETALTYFEFATLAAMHGFIRERVEVAIMEVGLGGRLDAVNVFDNDCAVITSIDLDHIDYLGDNRELIGAEKAGVMRAGKVVVCAEPDIPASVMQHANACGAQLWRLGQEFGYRCDSMQPRLPVDAASIPIVAASETAVNAIQWQFYCLEQRRHALPYPALRGEFQLLNASAALAALQALQDKLPVSMGAIRRGLTEVELPGRFQVFPGKPLLILDVAHNPHAAAKLADNLSELPAQGQTIAVVGMLQDKDIAGVLALLAPLVDQWCMVTLDSPRAATAQQLQQQLQGCQASGTCRCFDSVEQALQYAYNSAGENDRIAAFGSFFTVADALQIAEKFRTH